MAARGLALLRSRALERCITSPRCSGWQARAHARAAAAARRRWHCSSSSSGGVEGGASVPVGIDAAPAPLSGSSGSTTTTLVATSEAGTRRLAAALAADLRPGDTYLLRGSVGAGKSAFSRAFIRAAADDPWLTVPSPTFLLQQIYEDHEGPPIHHFDLYRLEGGGDVGRLELPASFARAVCLVEWPERLPAEALPGGRLEVGIEIVVDEAERRRLEEQCRLAQAAGSRAAAAGSSSSGSEEWGEEEGDDGADDDPYTDRRWRRITLQPYGADWEQRLGRVAHAAACGALSRHVLPTAPASGGAAAAAAAADPGSGSQRSSSSSSSSSNR
ncbi:hypothetical protein Rsub_03809 [Raphidocelis subcapitata]|uniref:tRNA threonylcarbamoyladenosine biosynthesis protein TsaE n=1 Tax=Raphidocelis subcapitata TaxID=307507 RepID=A0A2V0NTJ2_9CHLO|nr:hypothetical protein Rsub_03809 [Raphidocelis subcapitata]|eukprot:GBF90954.1 hypothetical protein Rsub_03809 [Raphidocelis subcapitata]